MHVSISRLDQRVRKLVFWHRVTLTMASLCLIAAAADLWTARHWWSYAAAVFALSSALLCLWSARRLRYGIVEIEQLRRIISRQSNGN